MGKSHCESGDIIIKDCWLPGDLRNQGSAGGGGDGRILLLDVEPVW